MDIETEFMNGVLEEVVYMHQPRALEEKRKLHNICKLLKSLYGLKQAPRAWHKALTDVLIRCGYEPLQCKACIYVSSSGTGKDTEIVTICVDDLALVAN